MRYSGITFFVDDTDDRLFAHLRKDKEQDYPITLSINDSYKRYSGNKITIFLTEQQLINFKNSLISEYELLLKGER